MTLYDFHVTQGLLIQGICMFFDVLMHIREMIAPVKYTLGSGEYHLGSLIIRLSVLYVTNILDI